jgi:hypothetical protein
VVPTFSPSGALDEAGAALWMMKRAAKAEELFAAL